MNTLIPAPDAIPVSWGYFKFLLMLTFPLHLILMNSMLGSAAIALYACLKGDETSKRLAYELAKVIPFLIAFAVNLGVAALLFLQVLYGHFFYTSSIVMGAYWIAVIPLVLVAYYSAYLFDFKFSSLGKGAVALVSLSLFIFLGIAFLFSNNITFMLDPEAWNVYFANPAGTSLNLGDPVLLPRYLHFIVGGIAVGGLFVALVGKMKRKMASDVRAAAENIGMKVFTFFTGVQVASGFWFLLSLPQDVIRLFTGGDALATLIFIAGFLLALVVLAAGISRKVYAIAVLVVPLVYIMSFMRDSVRSGYLKPHFSPESLQVLPQYSPMFLFFFVLVAGIAPVVWMLRKALGSLPQAEEER